MVNVSLNKQYIILMLIRIYWRVYCSFYRYKFNSCYSRAWL